MNAEVSYLCSRPFNSRDPLGGRRRESDIRAAFRERYPWLEYLGLSFSILVDANHNRRSGIRRRYDVSSSSWLHPALDFIVMPDW